MTSLHADEAFLGHYQFSHDPFAPRVPGFKFFPAQRKPVLGQLHHLARYSQLLLLVTGPLGSGKTLLRQALVASTNKDAVLSVVISARTAADETSLLRQVAQGLSINQASLEAILTKVAQLAITGQDVYLMVDDAEQLQDSALEVLLLLASGTNEGRLHVFLFGEPSLLPRLEVFSEGEERFHAIELQPYSEEETRDYLAQRLEGAGQGIELISNDLLVDIHEQSEGWPGAINQVARDALIEAMLANRGAARKATGGSFNLPKKHLVILAVVAIGVIAAWFMQGKSKPEAPQTASTELSMNGGTPAQAQQPGSGPAVEFNGSSQPLPLPLVGESQPVIREPLAQAAGQGGDDEGGLPSAAVPPTVSSSAPPVTPLANNGVTPMHPVPPAPTEPTAPAATPTPAQTPAPAAPVASAPASKPAPAPAKPAASKPAASKPATTAAAKPAPAPAAKPASGGGAGSQWYRNQSGGNFALQILGTGSEANAQAFIRQQGGGDFRYFKKTLQGKPFYVVTYGSFPNRAAALAAVKKLPSKVQAGKPWPRTFASIQQEIGQAH
ncbi:AAA family ATPase [Pseudomonas aeruginosa]|jgi:DamX protein|uniref:AAA family ATPase n=1 Tax=Pseudomonas aeruginosa TaxID=287 RepID=UPI0005D9439D|nr:AAA family ATPase [Pseudomonas aeruginosa]AKO89222.1 cell division protein [Pseudomonas aeruginosa DSM 50071 = NBRC 12689]KAA5580777.1 AAA family ATPase [Pseudomonas aeruginosa]KMN03787.1 cell division protein [Pseudomonas aeruginosa]MBA4565776.1 AAA family ATPase [Pseudomonas aeruginosa]MBH9144380.1 AAA family ATPase [Pseudomonas aeruginosa]